MPTVRAHTEYDAETNLWVVQRANLMAEEVQKAKFREGLLQRTTTYRTIYDQHGRPICKVRCHDFGATEHVFDNHQDAIARPQAVRMNLRERLRG